MLSAVLRFRLLFLFIGASFFGFYSSASAEVGAETLFRQYAERWLEKPDQSIDWEAQVRSIQELESDIEQTPDDERLLIELSYHRLAAGEDEKAIEILRRVIELDAQNAPAHTILGYAISKKATTYPIRKRDSQAHVEERNDLIFESDNLFTTAVSLSPNDKYIRLFWADAQFGRSIDNILLLPTGDPEPILDNLRKAQEIDPSDLRVAAKLAYVLEYYGTTYISLYSKNPLRLPWVPTDFSGQGRIYLEEAVVLYEDLLENDPTKSIYYENYTSSLTGLGRYEEAIVVCKSVIEEHKDSQLAHDAYGWWKTNLYYLEHYMASPESGDAIEKARSEYREHKAGAQD